jgi:hypothetical protein
LAKHTGLIAGIAIVLSAVLGGGIAIYQIGNAGAAFGSEISVRGWQSSSTIGSSASNPIERALIARKGLLALARKETIYFSLAKDDRGAALEAKCTYEIKGDVKGPQARWWSITLYAADDYLAVNGDQAGSVDITRMVADPAGAYVVTVSSTRGEAKNWLSNKNAGQFSLSMRLYNPSPEVQADMTKANLPSVSKASCEGAA